MQASFTVYGPAYDDRLDGPRLRRQHQQIREWMLAHGGWRTLAEIREALGYSDASISAQLRHLRKPQFGSYRVEKRRRNGRGTWEYRVSRQEKCAAPAVQAVMTFPSEVRTAHGV